jgi:hypothetical protein
VRAGLAAALLSVPFAAPLSAQDMTAAECTGLALTFAPLIDEVDAVLPAPTVDGGWCAFDGAGWETAGEFGQRISIETLRLRGAGLERLAAFGAPDRLEIEIAGLRLIPKLPDPRTAWVFEVQTRRNDTRVSLNLSFDAATRTVRLERAEAWFWPGNRVAMTAEIAGLDMTSPDAMGASLAALDLRAAEVVVETSGLFEYLALMPLATQFLPEEGDIGAAAEVAKAEAIALLDTLPPAMLQPGAKDALTAAIGALPAPSGTLTLTATTGGTRLAEALAGEVLFSGGLDAEDFADVRLGAAWVPAPEGEETP